MADDLTTVDIPIVDEKADMASVSGWMKLGMIIVGFIALFVASTLGQQGAGWVMNIASDLTGRSLGGGSPGGVAFGGEN